ncbi:unnamed protein product [Wuchereria bancrofti]|uniref:Uncharacterized protein n=1 Tax=Wuchereria bancrofti TaxID=6293 RepID=A0A3P7EHW1_WUCBA|nr:unnamed protein product [Wuchereria bancrofti]
MLFVGFNYPSLRQNKIPGSQYIPRQSTDTIITLSMYKDDAELALKRLKRNKEPSLTECRPVVNLPQLSLPTFRILKHGESFGVVLKLPYTLKTYSTYKS